MKVLLADDHDLVRDGLIAILSRDDPSIKVSAVEDLDRAFGLLEDEDFDVVVLDLRMPGMRGLEGLRRMTQLHPQTPIVLMSGLISQSDVAEAYKIGIQGFVPKTLAGKALSNALRLVVAGERYVPSSMIPNRMEGDEVVRTDKRLSPRERQVLERLAQGASNKEIAYSLEIKETTVKLHLRNLGDKLDARNRTEIVIRAMERGLVSKG
ncbi:MAG: response regulator transcription factor [Rhodospirillales bacterium]